MLNKVLHVFKPHNWSFLKITEYAVCVPRGASSSCRQTPLWGTSDGPSHSRSFVKCLLRYRGAVKVSLLLENWDAHPPEGVGTFILAELLLATVYSSFQEGVSSQETAGQTGGNRDIWADWEIRSNIFFLIIFVSGNKALSVTRNLIKKRLCLYFHFIFSAKQWKHFKNRRNKNESAQGYFRFG